MALSMGSLAAAAKGLRVNSDYSERPRHGCLKQAVIGAPVRATAAPASPYDGGTGARPAMNVTLKPFDFAGAVARAGLGTDGVPLAKGGAVAGTGFQKALGQALDAVNRSQNDAATMQREVTLDNPTVSLEQTMVSMQKAQIGFQATLQVRNRLVQAYSDIMGMQV
jgi:flagellar hook-basal body complex protein FliE